MSKNKGIRQKIIDILCDDIKKISDEYCVDYAKTIETKAEEFAANGLIKSGSFVEALNKTLAKELGEYFTKVIEIMNDFQTKLNISFNDNEFDYIEKYLQNMYQSLVRFSYEQRNKWLKLSRNDAESNQPVTGIIPSSFPLISEEINKLKFINREKRDPVDILYQKKQYRLSVWAFIISLIAIVISVIVAYTHT